MTMATAPAAPVMLEGWLPQSAATTPMIAAVCRPTTGATPATTLKASASGTMESETVRPASTFVRMAATPVFDASGSSASLSVPSAAAGGYLSGLVVRKWSGSARGALGDGLCTGLAG